VRISSKIELNMAVWKGGDGPGFERSLAYGLDFSYFYEVYVNRRRNNEE
jgi:hypothetical protein